MGFMEPQVYESDYLEVDGPMGVDVIPCDVVDLSFKQLQEQIDTDEIDSFSDNGGDGAYYSVKLKHQLVIAAILDYCENREVYAIERKRGFVGRMSAPGYMDCTPWGACATEKEMFAELKKYYGDEEESDET